MSSQKDQLQEEFHWNAVIGECSENAPLNASAIRKDTVMPHQGTPQSGLASESGLVMQH